MSELALLEIDGTVATLSLNRPDKRNALSLELLDALHEKTGLLAQMPEVHCCRVVGTGNSFCAGMDLKAALDTPGAPGRLLSSIAELTIKFRNLPQVTVARVQGAAIGGGCGLVAVCDIAVTHRSCKMGYPEVDLGVCPAVVAPWLVRSIGAGRARRVLLSGGVMDGAEAYRLGLVAHLTEDGALDGAVDEIVGRLGDAGGVALRETKRLLNDLDGEDIAARVREGAVISAEVVDGPEARARLAEVYG